MKASFIGLALAAAHSATASPTPTEEMEVSKRADSLPAVSASGNAFYAGGQRWYIRGIDYQPGGEAESKDPLADASRCKPDIELMKELGVNTVRVYSVDNSKNHDECMKALADAGIYLVLDVNNSKYSINRDNPHPSYNAEYLQSVFATIEVFAQYDNTAAFFSGNEVVNDKPGTVKAAPYVKAVTRDMKNYINTRGLRQIPVGYSAADVSQNREQLADYFNCGSDDMRSDFFAFNDYAWCDTSFEKAGWDAKVKHYSSYGLPIFLSEYGCVDNTPRHFGEIGALMSDKMTGVYSGGLMYQYSDEEDNPKYGIVDVSGDKPKPKPEFDLMKSALKKYPTPTGDGGASKTTHAVDCPTKDAKKFPIDSKLIPEMPEEAQKYMENGAGKGPGIKDPGSQMAADSGTATTSVSEGQASPTAESQQNNEGSGDSASGSDDEEDAASALAPGLTAMLVTGLVAVLL